MNNILDLKGPDFLLLLTGAQITALSTAAVIRQLTINCFTRVCGHELTFDPYEAAYLNGGAKHAFLSAAATLSNRNHIFVNESNRNVHSAELPSGSHWLEELIYKTAAAKEKQLSEIFSCIEPRLEHLRDKLIEGGMVTAAAEEQCAKLIFAGIASSPIIFLAVPKFFLGLERNRPVLFLLIFSAISLFIVYKLTKTGILRSSKGNEQLKDWRTRGDHLRVNMQTYSTGMSTTQLAMSYALFGTFGTSLLDPFDINKKSFWNSYGSRGSGGCGSSCGGGSGGGGCGGGCGGCS